MPRLEGVLPVELDVPVLRLDPELEACAYYLVAEALANAAKYAGASAATVSVAADVDAITVEITDDGCGGACATPGGGLEGLAERVSALGGTLAIESPGGRGDDVARGAAAAAAPLLSERRTAARAHSQRGSYRPATPLNSV